MPSSREVYIEFRPRPRGQGRKTDFWEVYSLRGHERLGEINWYSTWRKYCFLTQERVILDAFCLTEIVEFLRVQTELQKAGWKKKEATEW